MSLRILLFFIAVYFGISSSFHFEPRNQKAGLTFVKQSKARISYDSYTMLYHLDLTEYKKLINLVSKFINDANVHCKELRSNNCRSLLNQLITHLNHLKRDDLDIEAYQQRSRGKRALEFYGSFLHWAFGLMDAATAREYDMKINEIQNKTGRFHNILQEQTILIREMIKLNNESISHLEVQIKNIKQHVGEYYKYAHNHMNWVYADVSFTSGVTFAKFIVMEHQRLSQQILRCLEDVASGKITQLIPREKLISDLIEIETHLCENQKLPIDYKIENPLHIFKYSKISASLYGDRLLLEVTIPIVERESYTAYKIIPIPTFVNNNTVILNPSTHYVLINDEQKEYIPITLKEFNNGKFNMRGERIIKPAENARIEYSQNCEISIFMNPSSDTIHKYCDIKVIPTSNYFISINSNDMFYAQIFKPVMITEYCRNKPVKNQEITESGLIQLDQQCRITTDKISLRPRANFRFESKDIIILSNKTQNLTFEVISTKINTLNNFSIPNNDDNILIQDYTSDFNNLFDKADKLIERSKNEAKWEEIHYDNIKHKKSSYIFTGNSNCNHFAYHLVLL